MRVAIFCALNTVNARHIPNLHVFFGIIFRIYIYFFGLYSKFIVLLNCDKACFRG